MVQWEVTRDAAFALHGAYQGGPFLEEDWPRGGNRAEEEDEEDEEKVVALEWDEPEFPLCPELAFLLKEVSNGRRKTDWKAVLEKVPKYTGLPVRGPENNHRADAKGYRDRQLRDWQTKVLHILRVQAHLYGMLVASGAVDRNQVVLQQQLFQMTCELASRIENQRRENTIPGSTRAGGDAGELLFNKEDLTVVATAAKINREGKGTVLPPQQGRLYSFRPYTSLDDNFTGFKRRFPLGKGTNYDYGYKGGLGFRAGFSSFKGASPQSFRGKGLKGRGKGTASGRAIAALTPLLSQGEKSTAMVASECRQGVSAADQTRSALSSTSAPPSCTGLCKTKLFWKTNRL